MMASVRSNTPKTSLELQMSKIALELTFDEGTALDVNSRQTPCAASSVSPNFLSATKNQIDLNGGDRNSSIKRAITHQSNRYQSNSNRSHHTNFCSPGLIKISRNMFVVDLNQKPITTDEPPEQVFQPICELGHGSSGQVTKMLHKPTNTICAVKRMHRTNHPEENKRINMDLQTVLECHCDNIVRSYGYFIKDSEVWICMELMTTCFDKLMKIRKKPLPESFLGAIAASTLKALDYLKEKYEKIHRDVKPSNILINEQGQIKLCDFGISGKLINSQAKTRSAGCIWYMAPERVHPDSIKYDVRSDVWSLGMTLVELATAERPFTNLNDFEVMSLILQNEPPMLPKNMNFTPECRDFVSLCLTKNYEDRPKYKRLINHPFIIKHMNTQVSLQDLE